MKNADLILIILLVVLICVLVYSGYFMSKEESKCLKNPYTYSIEKASEYFNKDISCYCDNGITINKTGMFRKINNWKI